MRVHLRTRPNFVQLIFLIPVFCGIIIGCAFWLAALVNLDDPLLIANPGWVLTIIIGNMAVIGLSIFGILYCYALLIHVIVKHVSYQTLKADLDNLVKRE